MIRQGPLRCYVAVSEFAGHSSLQAEQQAQRHRLVNVVVSDMRAGAHLQGLAKLYFHFCTHGQR